MVAPGDTKRLLDCDVRCNNWDMTHPLRTYRHKTGLSLDALASRVNTTKTSLSRIERGVQTPSLALVLRLVRESGGLLRADDFLPAITKAA